MQNKFEIAYANYIKTTRNPTIEEFVRFSKKRQLNFTFEEVLLTCARRGGIKKPISFSFKSLTRNFRMIRFI